MSSGGDAELAVLRPALELGLVVARDGLGRVPAVAAPGPVRPLLRFSRLSERALSVLRSTIDDDDDFRRRVAGQAEEDVIGRLPFLWLTRADGWAAELAAAARGRAEAADQVREEQAERSARKRLAAAEEALARTERALDAARGSAEQAVAEATEHRQGRRAAEDRAREVAAALEAARRAERELRATVERSEASERELRARLHDAHEQIRRAEAERDVAVERAWLAEARQAGTAAAVADAGAVRAGVGRAIADAASAAQRLGRALSDASSALAGDGAGDHGPPRRGAGADARPPQAPLPKATGRVRAGPGGGAELSTTLGDTWRQSPIGAGTPSASAARPGPLRRAVPLPPAVFDDSIEAADHLVRVERMLLLVDGYNVSLATWSDRPLAEQRRYLIDRLASLAARTGVAVRVVFDGDDDHRLPGPPGRARSAVREVFSPPGVDADEVILQGVEQTPVTTPVLVATSDRRVADEARRLGANVISSNQLLGLLGRGA